MVGRAAQRGYVVVEEYLGTLAPRTKHPLMSVSKPLVGVVAGALADQGHLDPDAG